MSTLEGDVPLRPEIVEAAASSLARQGYRILAVAEFAGEGHFAPILKDGLNGLTLIGLVGMIDPLRPTSKPAIESCRRAGVEVAMITGDHPETALAIARELQLGQSREDVVTGAQMKKCQSNEELDRLVRSVRIFARIEPKQKLLITQSLIRQKHFVAITGDGANDAPALKAAHLGVAMGLSGTDVARETSDLILADDQLSSIVAGIEEGRVAYANVRKVIYFLVATGLGEIFLFLFSLLAGLPLPLTAIQLLWLNVVTEGIQDVTLAFEPAEGGELQRPPRPPQEPIFNRLMIERVILSALTVGGVAFGLYYALLKSGVPYASAQNQILLLVVLFENILVGCSRSETKSIFALNPLKNKYLLIGTVAAQGLHIWAMHNPFLQDILGVSPVSFSDWMRVFLLATIVIFVNELRISWSMKNQIA